MYPLHEVIELVKVGTGFRVIPAPKEIPNFKDEANTYDPTIAIGYGEMESKDPNVPRPTSIIHELGEDLSQSFYVHYYSSIASLHLHWRKVFQSLIGKNTQPKEFQFNGFTLREGKPNGIEGDFIWYEERWQISFPTLYMFPK